MADDHNPIDRLIVEYATWNKAQGLNLGSADEHVWDEDLTDAQRAWLRNFVKLWDAAAELERAWADAERLAFEGECNHSWVENGDEQHHGEGRIYCEWCGADGDA
jgi:hypothetical protein